MAQVRFGPTPTSWSGVSLAPASWCWLLWWLPSLSFTWFQRYVEEVTVPDTDDDRCPACGGDVDIALVGVVTIDDRTESIDSGMCSTCGKHLSRPLGSQQWRM